MKLCHIKGFHLSKCIKTNILVWFFVAFGLFMRMQGDSIGSDLEKIFIPVTFDLWGPFSRTMVKVTMLV